MSRLAQDGAQEVANGLNAIADSIRALTQSIGATATPAAEAAAEAAGPDAADAGGVADVSWWSDNLSLAKEKAIDFAPSLLAAVIIMVLGWLVARLITATAKKALGKSKLDPTLVNFAGSCLYFALLSFVFIAAATKIGFETSSFVAIIGAATFAIGFALQGSLANFAAGVMLMIFRPIREGDLIEAGGVLGIVDEIGVFATVINTLENKRATIANASITGGNIINYTANGQLRVDMTFGIGYGDDMDQAMKLMEEVLAQDDRVLAEPAPTVACSGHGASSVDFVCRPHVKPEHYWDVWFDTHKKVKEAFDTNGISIPYPQRDIHMIADAG